MIHSTLKFLKKNIAYFTKLYKLRKLKKDDPYIYR